MNYTPTYLNYDYYQNFVNTQYQIDLVTSFRDLVTTTHKSVKAETSFLFLTESIIGAFGILVAWAVSFKLNTKHFK